MVIGFWKITHIKSFLSIQLYVTYSLSPFLLITFYILNYVWSVFCNSFSQNVPKMYLLLSSHITCLNGTVFLTFLITKISSGWFGTQPLAKMVLYFDILTLSPILSWWSFLLFSTPGSMSVLDFASTDFSQTSFWLCYDMCCCVCWLY